MLLRLIIRHAPDRMGRRASVGRHRSADRRDRLRTLEDERVGLIVLLLLGAFAACTSAGDDGRAKPPTDTLTSAADTTLADADAGDAAGATRTDDGGSTPDAELTDAGITDAEITDAGITDAGITDAGSPDTASPDTASPDTASPDAASPDAASPDTMAGLDPLIEPTIAQPTLGPVPTPSVVCPTDGVQKQSLKYGYQILYATKSAGTTLRLHGPYSWTTDKKVLTAKGCYINSKMAGKFETWRTDGSKQSTETFTAAGLAQGLFQEWDAAGNLRLKTVYKDGKAWGESLRWYAGGTQVRSREYFNPAGQPLGVQQTWHPNGQIRTTQYYDAAGKLTGTMRQWADNGTLVFQGNYVDGLRHGTHRSWHENGAIAGTTTYVKGTGSYKVWHENGQVWAQGELVAGKREGLWQLFTATGVKVDEANHKANAGPVERWFTSGAKWLVAAYDGDLQFHGPYMEWSQTGVQTWSGTMHHGRRVGSWQWTPVAGTNLVLCYVDGYYVMYEDCPAGLLVK